MEKNKPPKWAQDLTGERFDRLFVLHRAEDGLYQDVRWLCRCDCGKESVARSTHLRSGKHKSCGCLQRETATKHGMEGTKIYNVWASMLQRCRNPNHRAYHNYGGRGIRVCERWYDFAAFFTDMGHAPIGLTLDRINNDGDYEPANCRWATLSTQQSNKRRA